MIRRGLLPNGVDATVLLLLIGKSLRAFADGYVAVLLPAYLLALHHDDDEGVIEKWLDIRNLGR